jgi:photosystem II stability/assembly factor-like uncharacterized protein
MKKLYFALLLFFFSSLFLQSANTTVPEDWLGRVPVPSGSEVEVVKFKTDQIVYAGTNGSGLYVSYDAGTGWVKLTGFPEDFPCIKDFLIAPNKDLYAATYGGGVYYSKDNGATWQPKNTGLKNLYTQALAITRTGKLLCGTYGGGIYYSDDKGENWVRTDKGLRNDNVTCITEMRSGFIMAGTYGGGFFVSRDTCKTWLVANTLLTNIFINDLAKDPAGHVFAATNGAGAMMTDDGITWHIYSNLFHYKGNSNITPILDTAITTVGSNGYQLLMGTRSAGMYFYDDLWVCWQNTGDFTVGITACDVSPSGMILATRTVGDVTRSTDNGMTWDQSAKQIVKSDSADYADDENFLKIFTSRYDNSLISISKSDSMRKIYKSTNHGNNWQYLGEIKSKKVNDLEVTKEGNIFIAADEGIFISTNAGKTFDLSLAPKDLSNWRFTDIEYDSIINCWAAVFKNLIEPEIPSSPPTVISRIYKSIDKGLTWTFKNYGAYYIQDFHIDIKGIWYFNLVQIPGKDNYFVKSLDHGASKINVYDFKTAAYCYGNDRKLYYYKCYDEGFSNIYVSENFDLPFSQIPFTPDNTFSATMWYIRKMTVDIYGNLYIGVLNSSISQGQIYEVYKTSDMGLHWQNLRGSYNIDIIRGLCSDPEGYTYVLTNALYKVIDSVSLKAPKTISPKYAQMGEEINPVFAWERAKYAEEYELQIDQTDLFYTPFETNVTGDTSCKVVLDLKFNQEYYWRIRSKTHHSRSGWRIGKFTTGMEAPFLISPEKGKLGVPLNAALKWHKKEDATHYTIQVAEDENFDKIVYSQDKHPDTTITTDKLTGLKTYYWRVKAFTSNNASSWSEVWNFRTVMGPPQLIYPENNSMDKLLSEQFKWHKSAEAETYFIQVAKDTAFTDLFFEGSAGADTFKIIDNMLPETDYYWHISSVNTVGTSEYSERWTFRTSFKPVELLLPVNKMVNIPLNTLFTWLEHNGGSQYQIQISKVEDFKTTIVDEKVNNLLEYQTNKLEYYKDYFWRVRLIVGTRVGLWSEIWKFKTGILTADLLNPPDKSIDQPTTIKFKWYEVVGAKYYQLQISKNEEFTNIVYSMDSLNKAEQYKEDLEPELLYYWHVRAWNDESYGTSQWSQVWTFTTGEVTLILRNPKTGTTGVAIPTLLFWFSATTSEYYHLQVAKDADFTNVICNKDSIYDTKWTLAKTDVETNTNYFWRVKGVSQKYTTPWSETWQFTTGEVSVKESELFTSIKLYPNPTGSKAELSINYAEACDAKILITTAEGKIIRTDAIRLLLGETRYEIDAEHLTSGTYYITIVTPSGYVTRELVVVK